MLCARNTGSSRPRNQAERNTKRWHTQQVCTASTALPDHRDFYGNTKGNRGRFFRRKACPSRAKLTGAQPEASAQPVSALLPCFCPSSSCQLWQGRILHPSAVEVCRDLSPFAQLEASPTAVSQTQGPTQTHIYTYIYTKISAQ